MEQSRGVGADEGEVGMQPMRLYGSALVIMVTHMRLATLLTYMHMYLIKLEIYH